jgi:hypothetical protein
MPNIEIEDRALLSPIQRDKMLDYMQTLGVVKEIRRVMIDFSGENRIRTITLRINNGVQELVVKSGGLSDERRQEAQLELAAHVSLGQTLSYFAIMGYTDAMVSQRSMFVAKTEKIEYSLRDVLAYDTGSRVSTLLEIEARNVVAGEEQAAGATVQQAFEAHDITPLTHLEWEQWVKETYDHVDHRFQYTPENARAIAASLVKSAQLN